VKKKIICLIIIISLLLNISFLSAENIKSAIKKNDSVEYWAITISTKGDGWDNLALTLRDILCENNWKKENIIVLAGPNATYGNVVDSLNWLIEKSDANDKVLFHHMGHGGDKAFTLNDNYMLYSDLDLYLDNISSDGIIAIFNACYSGNAIQYLAQEGRVILTATDSNNPAHGSIFTEFCSIGLKGFADFKENNDTFISAEELYTFVKNDTTAHNLNVPPQISDSYEGELNIVTFSYLNWLGLLDQYNVRGGGEGYNPLVFSNWKAQSFIPTYPVLSAVALHISNKKGNPGPITVSIRENLQDDDLCSVTYNQSNFYSNGFKFFTFDIPDINVTIEQQYWILLKSYGPDFNNCYYTMDANNSYPKGGVAVSYDQGDSWTMGYYNSHDLYFATLGRPIDDPPAKPDNPIGSTTGFPNKLYTFSTSSNDPEGDQIYYKWNWGDGNFSKWIGPFDSDESAEAKYSWKEKGTHKIRVKAKDQYCAESNWSNTLSVEIDNNPPSNPEIFGPVSGNKGKEYYYTFLSNDSDGHKIKYLINWGDGSEEETVYVTSGTELTLSHLWMEQGTFVIKAKAKDIFGDESNWATFNILIKKNQIKLTRLIIDFFERYQNLLTQIHDLVRM